MKKKTAKEVKMHKFLACSCKSQDFAQGQKNFARSHNRTTARFKNSVRHGCKDASFMGFSHFIFEHELTSENMYFPMNLAKKSQFHFSFFKLDSQNPKFSSGYLWYFLNTFLTPSYYFPSHFK